ncbi:MAG TPA: twin-arginine translocase TatA/TatE family subunit [Solirubrobacterales bacterium]
MFSGLESPMHLLVVLIVAILVLGPKKLPDAARGLGSGIRQFKDSIEGKETATPVAAPPVTAAPVATATSASIEATPVAAETE